MQKVGIGDVVLVENTNPRPNASLQYAALWVEEEGGGNARCLMFRKADVGKFPKFEFPSSLGVETELKPGRLYRMSCGTIVFYVVKIIDRGNERIVKLTDKKISVAERLAEMNPQDIPAR